MKYEYESLSEIFSMMEETRARLFERVAGLHGNQESFRANPEAWSVAEIIEHVSIVEKQILTLTNLMLMKAETGGAPAPADARIGPISLDKIVERSMGEKYQAPETARPSGKVPVADSLALMQRTHASLQDLRPRLAATNLASVSYPHPIFGPLNLYEWLVMIGLHEQRHLSQIEATFAAAPRQRSV